MIIQPNNPYADYYVQTNNSSSSKKESNDSAEDYFAGDADTDRVVFSQTALDILSSKNPVIFDTDQGAQNLDIDAYFMPDKNQSASLSNSLPPLLLPTPNNVAALSRNISSAMPKFLSDNNIPSAPSSIDYDSEGKIQLPDDYEYADQFKQALENNPAMENKLRTVHALASHVAEMQKITPFQQEYSAASSESAREAVVNKYSYLFSSNKQYTDIALQFSLDGALSLTADGQPYQV